MFTPLRFQKIKAPAFLYTASLCQSWGAALSLCISHFLEPSIGSPKRLQVRRGCNQKKTRKVCQAYARSGTRIAEHVESK